MADYEKLTSPRHDLSQIDGHLRDGLALTRQIAGPILEVCSDLQLVRDVYPFVRLNGLPREGEAFDPLFRVDQVTSSEIIDKRRFIGDVPIAQAIRAMLEKVPGLNEPIPTHNGWVDTKRRKNGTQVKLLVGAFELLRLSHQRHQIFDSLSEQAGSKSFKYVFNYLDTTIAYIPDRPNAADALAATLGILDEHGPLEFTLLPVGY
jgi:hypothetical protein